MLEIFVVELDFSFLRTTQFYMHSLPFGFITHVTLMDIDKDNTPSICETLAPQSVKLEQIPRK